MEKLYMPVKKSSERKFVPSLSFTEIFLCLAGLLFPRAMPFGGVAPFGLSFLSTRHKMSRLTVFTYIGTVIGSLWLGDKLLSIRYICAGFLYMASLFVLEKGEKTTPFASAVIVGISLAVTESLMIYWAGFKAEYFLIMVFDVALAVAGSFFLNNAVSLIKSGKISSYRLSEKEKIHLGLFFSIMLMGLSGLEITTYFSLSHFVCILLLLIIAESSGAGVGGSSGVILGLISGIGTDYLLPTIGIFGFSGFLSGMFSRFGKGGAVSGLAVANAVIAFYINGIEDSVLTIYEIIGSSIVFALLPVKFSVFIRTLLTPESNDSLEKLKNGLNSRLSALIHALSNLASSLSRFTAGRCTADFSAVGNKTIDNVCRNCQRYSLCWEKNCEETKKAFDETMALLQKNSNINKGMLPDILRKGCVLGNTLSTEFNRQQEIYTLKKIIDNNIRQSQLLARDQLDGISSLIENLSEEVEHDINFDTVCADNIRFALENKGIQVYDINVNTNRFGKCRIELSIKKLYWGSKNKTLINRVLSNITGCDMSIVQISEQGDLIILSAREREQFYVEHGAFAVSSSKESGDNFNIINLSSGKFVAILCDGMGTGPLASRQSKFVISLFDDFIKAGFSVSLSIRLINSFMALKTDSEVFVTLDICIIDLYSGKTEFIKTGGEPTFIRKGNLVETISLSSLPVGLVPQIVSEKKSGQLKDGDTIVMVTDGLSSRTENNLWIKRYIEQTEVSSPENFSKELINKAISKNNGEIKDDMTVVTLKIKRKSA